MTHFTLYAEVEIHYGQHPSILKVEVPTGLDADAAQSYVRGVRNALQAIKFSTTRADSVLETIHQSDALNDLAKLEATPDKS